MIDFFGKIVSWLSDLNPMLKAGMVVVTFLLTILAFIRDLWMALFARIDALVAPSLEGVIDFSPLSLANYVFPVDVLLSYLIGYAALRIALVGIRIIKSFVPTIA